MALEINDEVVLTPPVPAATVILLRDAGEGLQVLLMRRHAASGVLGGVHVFPGGKLDPADLGRPAVGVSADHVQTLAEPALDAATAAALYLAAVRETCE